MARVIPDPLAPTAVPRSRGRFLVRTDKRGFVAQKWPKARPGGPRTPYDWYRQEEFAIAARWASNPEPLSYATAVEMVKGTSLVPRDFLMMCSMGTGYEVILKDGTHLTAARRQTMNPQYVLDLVTDVPGSMLWRSDIGWVAVPPGLPGQALFLTEEGPSWEDVSGGGGGDASIDSPIIASINGITSEAYATQGMVFRALEDFDLTGFSQAVTFQTGRTYSGGIATVTGGGGTPTFDVVTPGIVHGLANAVATRNVSLFCGPTTPLAITAGDYFCTYLTRTDAANNSPLNTAWSSAQASIIGAPVQTIGLAQWQQLVPANGQVANRYVNGQMIWSSLRWSQAA